MSLLDTVGRALEDDQVSSSVEVRVECGRAVGTEAVLEIHEAANDLIQGYLRGGWLRADEVTSLPPGFARAWAEEWSSA